MAHSKNTPKYGMPVETKGKGNISHHPTADPNYYCTVITHDGRTQPTTKTQTIYPAIAQKVPNQLPENAISDTQLKDGPNDFMNKETILPLKRKKRKSKFKYFVLLIAMMVVIAAASSSVTALMLIKNFEDSLKRMPEEGTWSQWSDWGECSATCNVGVRSRNRTCNGLGQDRRLSICSGNGLDISTCYTDECTQSTFLDQSSGDLEI